MNFFSWFKNLSKIEILQLILLYIIAAVHYVENLVSVSLYVFMPIVFVLSLLNKNNNVKAKTWKYLISLYLWIIVDSIFTSDFELTLVDLKKILGAFMASYVMVNFAKDIKRVYLLYIAFLIFLISTWQYAINHVFDVMDFSTAQLSDDSHKLNANTFAYFTTYATFIIYLYGECEIRYRKILQYCFILTIALSFATAVFSSSRQLLIIQIPFIVLLLFNRYNIKSTKNIAILALIICASILAFVYYGESVYSNSYLSVRAESSIEEDTRLLIARECLDIGNQNFLFGVGPGCVSKFVSTGNFSHNTFLELYAGTGIIGLIIFTLMLINFLSVNYKRYKNTRNNEFAAMFIFGLIWTFDQIFYVFHNGLWLISFFILVSIHSELIHNKYQERKTIF